MSKVDKPEDGKDDKPEEKKEEVLDLSLDQVHERAVADLENEDDERGDDDDSSSNDKDGAEKEAGSDKDDSDDDDGASDDDKGGDKDDKDDAGNDGSDDGAGDNRDADDGSGGVGADGGSAGSKDADDKPAIELDTDTSKNGPGKVAVKDFDDKVHYFNNWDEVPDDFEPKSYKEMGHFTQRMNDKITQDRQDALLAEAKAADDAKAARIKAIKDDWEKDISSLTDEGKLPKDTKERQPVVDAVYDIMNKKLARGKVIDFETGFEIYSGQQGDKEVEDKKDKVADDKKKRGGMVVGAGAGTSAASKPRIIEGPPPGVTLDDVHENVLNSL